MVEKKSSAPPRVLDDAAVRLGAAELFALANIATLTGLLGTVFGLIHTFGAISKPGLSAAEKSKVCIHRTITCRFRKISANFKRRYSGR